MNDSKVYLSFSKVFSDSSPNSGKAMSGALSDGVNEGVASKRPRCFRDNSLKCDGFL
jgi:hypothetical protein